MALTTTLLNQTRDDVQDALEDIFLYGAVGTGTTTPAAGDTALEFEVFRDAIDEIDKSVDNQITASLRVLTTEANGNAITEVGLLDAAAAGNLWTHDLVNSINKTSDIQLFMDVEITINVTEGS